MIRYKRMKHTEITKHFLDDFNRYQVTSKVHFMEDDKITIKEEHFVETWDQAKKERISSWFQKQVESKKMTVVGVYDGKKLIGFSNIELPLFKGYINLQYLHVSYEYRNKGIGKELLYRMAIIAKEFEASKLYISTHPAIETQSFYKAAGCTNAQYIHPEIFAHEPRDIQLEFDLDSCNVYLLLAKHRMKKEYVPALIVQKIANSIYGLLPKDELRFLKVCRCLMDQDNISLYSMATLWLKKRKDVIAMRNIKYFEDILFNYVHGWGEVDQYCYRVLNPLIELDDNNYEYLLKWSDSKNKDVRRASLVSMIRSSGRLTLAYDYEKMIYLVEKLKDDPDFHVRKAVGWVLKCAYPTYPEKVEQYLKTNHHNLDRMIFRYALEHASKSTKEKLMALS